MEYIRDNDTIEIEDKYSIKDLNIDSTFVFNLPLTILNVEEQTISAEKTYIPPLSTAIIGINNTAASQPYSENIWTDLDAQEQFLKSKPTSYIILGKPSLGAFSLGEELSKRLKCIHLCPYNILKDEILKASPTGKCIDFNLSHNKTICYDNLLKLLKQKLNSSVIVHRGYVLSGFPLVTAKDGLCSFIESLNSEESLEIIQNIFQDLLVLSVSEKKQRKISLTEEDVDDEFLLEEEHEVTLDDPSVVDEENEEPFTMPEFVLDPLQDVIIRKKPVMYSTKAYLADQLRDIFNLIEPDIVIYLTCPDNDVITMKHQKFYDFMHETPICYPFSTNDITLPNDWPVKYKVSIDSNVVSKLNDAKYYFNSKYDCVQPYNFNFYSNNQLCNHQFIIPLIENKLVNFNPKHVIKLDGRFSADHLMNQIEERLAFVNVNTVIIPKPLYVGDTNFPENIEEFWKAVEESYVINTENFRINRSPSPWLNRCPVELKKGINVQGKVKYATEFLKHVYLLDSYENLITFCNNPRPFLQSKFLEPICRVFVLGTDFAGKSMVSKCLAWLFDAEVFCFQDLLAKLKQIKLKTFSIRILPEIRNLIQDARNAVWEKSEMNRISHLNRWIDGTLEEFNSYVTIHQRLATYLVKEEELVDEEEKIVDGEEKIVDEKEKIDETEKILNEQVMEKMEILSKLLLNPGDLLNNIDECVTIIEDRNKLLPYAPLELFTPFPIPKEPVLGDKDVTDAVNSYIISNELQAQLELTTEEIFEELKRVITSKDIEAKEASNNEKHTGKWIFDGFVYSPELWALLIDFAIIPDYVISILENNEITPEIIVKYRLRSNLSRRDDSTIFRSLDDPLVHIRSMSEDDSTDYETNIKNVSKEIIDRIIFVNISDNIDNIVSDEEISIFRQKIETYRANIDELRTKLTESSSNHFAVIEIEMENKNEVQILEEVLLKLRLSYNLSCPIYDPDNLEEETENETENISSPTGNDLKFYGETNKYCPIAFYQNNVLWEGKSETTTTFNNKVVACCNEDSLLLYQKDPLKYQSHNFPFKKIPSLRICVMGCIGSGKTTLSHSLSSELGLLHIDFFQYINEKFIPKHFEAITLDAKDETNDNLSTVQLEEDLDLNETNLFLKEKLLNTVVFNYFERGEPLPPKLVELILCQIWFTEPYCSTGFVLDGFPRLNTDVEQMIKCFCIPSVIVEIESDSEQNVNRVSNIMFRKWKAERAEAKRQFDFKRREWLKDICKKIVIDLSIDDILDNVIPIDRKSIADDLESQVSEFKANENVKLMMKYEEYVAIHPEPVKPILEDPNEVLDKIEERLQEIFDTEISNFESTKDMLYEQKIRIFTIDGTRSKRKVFIDCLLTLKQFRNINESFFEQTFFATKENAELLIDKGLVMISKYNRMCPVHIYENPLAIHNPLHLNNAAIYHIMHRGFIYFVFGINNLIKFRSNPLKYVSSGNIHNFIEYSLKIAVIGPTKSGKSSLVTKIANKFGVQPISRGIAIKYVLKNLYWTDLGKDIIKTLSGGKHLHVVQVMRAVQTVAMVPRVYSYGYVLDGFPQSPGDYMELCNIDLNPIIIFHILCDHKKIINNLQNETYYDIICVCPPFSKKFIENIIPNWKIEEVNKYINNSIQNVYNIDGNGTEWECWKTTRKAIEKFIIDIHCYLDNIRNPENVTKSSIICVSMDKFKTSMSSFETMCPICIRKNIIRHYDWPTDREGIIQYQNMFYWVCREHFNFVICHPSLLLLPSPDIPEIPAVVYSINKNDLHENGICIVTYSENLPSQKIIQGVQKYAAVYKGKYYLFCNLDCMTKFMEKPYLYYNITVFIYCTTLPKISVKSLPNIGYLEQSVANIVTDACTYINQVRPKYPGLDIKLSGLILFALYLKIHNPLEDTENIDVYARVKKVFEARCKFLCDLGIILRAFKNPLANYPVCCPSYETTLSSGRDVQLSSSDSQFFESGESTIDLFKYPKSSRVPVPDERYDHLVEYHKPASKVPAFLNVVDIAGLVKGAAEGQGLGNAFLSHIKACDAIFNLCRAFDDEDVIHVDGEVNPVRDLETIGEELRLKDEEQLLQHIEKLDRVVNRGNDKKLKPEYDALQRIKTVLVDEKKHIRFGDWSAADIEVLNKYLFITSKPALYLVNLSEKDYIRKKNKWLPKLKEWIDKNDPGAPLIPFSGVLELKLMDMDAQEKQAFLKENGVSSALDKIIVQGYKALQLEYFFTAGADEVKAWTIQKGTKAPQAAGRIHTDFEKGFIMAEVMHFKDFKEEGSESACKSAGKYRQQGRNYVVEDGDIIFFKFNAGAGLKDAKKK